MRINSEETRPNSIVALPIVCNCFSYLLVVDMRSISASESVAGAAASHFPDERRGDGRDVGFHPAWLRGATGVCLPHPEQADPRHCLGFHAQACRNRVWTTGDAVLADISGQWLEKPIMRTLAASRSIIWSGWRWPRHG